MENIKKLTVLIVEPDKEPYQKIIKDDLKELQEIVGGPIEAVELSDSACIFCNENGNIIKLPLNRCVGNDIIAGTFLIVGQRAGCEEISSLSKEDIELYSGKFKKVESFSQILYRIQMW